MIGHSEPTTAADAAILAAAYVAMVAVGVLAAIYGPTVVAYIGAA